jgi:hypothetical protein
MLLSSCSMMLHTACWISMLHAAPCCFMLLQQNAVACMLLHVCLFMLVHWEHSVRSDCTSSCQFKERLGQNKRCQWLIQSTCQCWTFSLSARDVKGQLCWSLALIKFMCAGRAVSTYSAHASPKEWYTAGLAWIIQARAGPSRSLAQLTSN